MTKLDCTAVRPSSSGRTHAPLTHGGPLGLAGLASGCAFTHRTDLWHSTMPHWDLLKGVRFSRPFMSIHCACIEQESMQSLLPRRSFNSAQRGGDLAMAVHPLALTRQSHQVLRRASNHDQVPSLLNVQYEEGGKGRQAAARERPPRRR